MRRIFVGDVQGCRTELEMLLDKLRFDPAGDQLHLVGDLIRRGPQGLATLELARAVDAQFVLGNHEAHLLDHGFFEQARPSARSWPSLGDFCALEAEERRAWGDYLRQAPLLRALPGLYVVHAAPPPALWAPEVGEQEVRRWTRLRWDSPQVSNSDKWFMTTTRYCDASGNKSPSDWPPPGEPFAPWDNWYEGERIVVFGHWARRGLVTKPRVRGLDTGCVYGGSLTAWIAEEDRIVQVPAIKAWIPT